MRDCFWAVVERFDRGYQFSKHFSLDIFVASDEDQDILIKFMS